MKKHRWALIVAVAGALVGAARAENVVEDATGRSVKLPDPAQITKVYAAGPVAAGLLFTLCPEKLCGFPIPISAGARAYFPPRFRDIPQTARLTGHGANATMEDVLKSGAQVVLDVGTVGGVSHHLARDTADKTGVPTLLMDGTLDRTAAVYRTLGKALGVAERGEKLAAYAEQNLAELDAAVKKATGEKPRVYYGRGPKGLESVAAGTISAEAIERAGAVNVASLAGPHGTLINVSPEDLIKWDPDLIITIEENAEKNLREDPAFVPLRAVKAGKLYHSPIWCPFGWIDYPPCANRILGMHWLVRLLHPGVLPDDLRAKVAEFHTLFYQQPLTDAQLDAMLAGLLPPRK